jgi:hypothetical protein
MVSAAFADLAVTAATVTPGAQMFAGDLEGASAGARWCFLTGPG